MADDRSDNGPDEEPGGILDGPDHFVDGQVTSSFPADGTRRSDGPLSEDRLSSDGPSGGAAGANADSWVDEWSSLFSDQSGPAPQQPTSSQAQPTSNQGQPGPAQGPSPQQPPTREMPILSAEQPPVGGRPAPQGAMPGHPDPAAAAGKPPAGRAEAATSPDHANRDAAEIQAWQKAQERTKRRAKVRANQRKAQVMQRQLPEVNDYRIEDAPLLGGANQRRSLSTLGLAVGGVVLVLMVVVAGYVFTGLGAGDSETSDQAAAPQSPADGQDLQAGADVTPLGISELALSTVQLLGLNDDLEPECAGSGVIARPDGTILTNAHVVSRQQGCDFSAIGVGITVDSSSPSQLLYRADVLAVDEALDLAVLKIAGPLRPGADLVMPEAFPAAPFGDSDTVELGDNVRVLGYPVIGGETITLTTGTVSGFTSQAGLGVRALIKTDATISAGNSGGMAIDPEGRVIGIPTKARASESGPAIDCRPLADTNDDGQVDELDNCVSVGGFLNGIRPINLALPLLGIAASADPSALAADGAPPEPTIDFGRVEISNPRFALGRQGNTPVDEVVTAQAGIPELCFFVDWKGIPAGSTWDGVWFVDGVLEQNLGFTDQEWTIAEDGSNFWLCAQEQNALGLSAGVYEIGFFLEDKLLFAEGIELTEEPAEVVEITWTNDTEGEICQLAVNPFSDSGQVGLGELDGDVAIPPGGSQTMDLPMGKIIAEAFDCEGQPVADAFDGLLVEKPATFLIGL